MRFTKLPNAIIAELAEMTDGEFRLTIALVSLIIQFHKKRRRLSHAQLMEASGLKRRRLIDSIKAVHDRKFFVNPSRGLWERGSKLECADSAHSNNESADFDTWQNPNVQISTLESADSAHQGANSDTSTTGSKISFKKTFKKEEREDSYSPSFSNNGNQEPEEDPTAISLYNDLKWIITEWGQAIGGDYPRREGDEASAFEAVKSVYFRLDEDKQAVISAMKDARLTMLQDPETARFAPSKVPAACRAVIKELDKAAPVKRRRRSYANDPGITVE